MTLKNILQDLRYNCTLKLEYYKSRKPDTSDHGSEQQEINKNIDIYTKYLLAIDAALDWIPNNAELHHRKWWPGFQQGKIIE